MRIGPITRFAAIDNIVKNDDGTIVVTGFASSSAVDSDGETITAEAMKAAIPDYMKFGAVREMHGKSAAGTAIEIDVQDDGRTLFSALIVDPIAIKKVETKTYKGFSIGGSVRGRDKDDDSIITSLKLTEVSLVDRPANPEALITMFKVDDSEKTEQTTTGPEATAPTTPEEAPADAEPVPVSEPAIDAEKVEKGMYSLSRFAELLTCIGSLAQDAAWEAEYEADGSPLPAQLKDWFASGVELFKAMTAEETAEMLAQLNAMIPTPTVVEVIEHAAGTEIEKAGAKFSASHKEELAAVHKMASDMCAKFDGMGYKDKETDDDEAEDDDKEKAASVDIEKSEIVIKLKADTDEIRKAFDIAKADLAKAQARVVELEAMPVAPKAGLFSLQVPISKAQDSGGLDEEEAPKEGTEEHHLWLMKKAQKAPMTKG